MSESAAVKTACEHHFVSRHQPDFPPPIYFVRVCDLCGDIDSDDLARELAGMPEADPWCREENCEWRNWRSGPVPTHKRGRDCPPVSVVVSGTPVPLGAHHFIVKELTAKIERLTEQRDEARRDRGRHAQTIEFRVKELDAARALTVQAYADGVEDALRYLVENDFPSSYLVSILHKRRAAMPVVKHLCGEPGCTDLSHLTVVDIDVSEEGMPWGWIKPHRISLPRSARTPTESVNMLRLSTDCYASRCLTP